MSTEDLGPPRWEVAREAFVALLDEIEAIVATELADELDPSVGLLTWSSSLEAQVGPTRELGEVRAGAEGIDDQGFGTDIGVAIDGALGMLPDAGGTVLLLSDGDDQGISAGAATDRAAEAGVVIHTVGLGAEGNEEFDPELLGTIAGTTGGIYRPAATPDELRAAFRQVLLDALAGAVVAQQLASIAAEADTALSTLGTAIAEGETAEVLADIQAARDAVAAGNAAGLEDFALTLVSSGIAEVTSGLAREEATTQGESSVPCEGASDAIRDHVVGAVTGVEDQVVGQAIATAGAIVGGAWASLGITASQVYTTWGFAQEIGKAYGVATACLAEVTAQIG